MSMWVLEFEAASESQATDIVRQHTAHGTPVPDVNIAGRHGYETASGDYGLIQAVHDDITSRGLAAVISRR